MSRLNLDPLMTFPDGSHLVIGTQRSVGREFSCILYNALIGNDDRIAFQALSHDFAASTCMSAQESAYGYARLLYPGAVTIMKKPPYLVWHGPHVLGVQ
ncbi:MAG: hypothetical protein OJF50_002730 [Nitrospira sp.]|jgi:hypothetical protein|nr:hypothetical protein [Nitrospira sp.]